MTDPRGGPTRLACKVCGAPARRWFDLPSAHGPPSLTFFLCRGCGLLFAGTPLDDDQLRAAYDAIDSGALYAAIAPTLRAKLERALRAVEPWLTGARPRLLDVGCGPGDLLALVRARRPEVEAVGLELPGARADAARGRGLTVSTGALDALEGGFDVVVMLDLAEHVPDPNRLFRDACARLRPGGLLYLHTPRRCAWDTLALNLVRLPVVRRGARAWLRTRVSIYHLHLWTDEALRRSLAQAGLRDVELRATQELGWPLELYLERHLRPLPRAARRLLGAAARLLVASGTLRNKAVVRARPCRGS
ncbi:MAG: class I SAM-dependent methyltransferase [Planctomycetes bacterium]|nr:class I SAM-dependent methyltransferase [Planctomycetota bacterium]